MLRRSQFLLAVLLASSVICFSQTDVHLLNNPGRVLFEQSSWAHGYLHGYEAGFHAGNLDLHMGRTIRDPHAVKEYKQSQHSFQKDFGSNADFSKGYGSGFEVGYLDGASGRDFRAASEVLRTANDLTANPVVVSSGQNHNFDFMLEDGYLAGRRKGLTDGRAKATFDVTSSGCPQDPKMQSFCTAYRSGFRWGYSDGYSNQRIDSRTQRASR